MSPLLLVAYLVLTLHVSHVKMLPKSQTVPYQSVSRWKEQELNHNLNNLSSSALPTIHSNDTLQQRGISSASNGAFSRKFNDFVRSTTSTDSQLMAASSSSPRPPTDTTRKSLLASLLSNSEMRVRGSIGKSGRLFSGPTENTRVSEIVPQEREAKLLLKLDRYYTPKEIAEYIVTTGDEQGIIEAVTDMLQDGQVMASRDDVILFLEEVQRELDKLRNFRED